MSRNAANSEVDAVTIGASGEQEGTIAIVDGGHVVIASNIAAFTCGELVSRPPIEIRAEIPGRASASLGTLAGEATIDIDSVVKALPFQQGEPENFDIVLVRGGRSVRKLERRVIV